MFPKIKTIFRDRYTSIEGTSTLQSPKIQRALFHICCINVHGVIHQNEKGSMVKIKENAKLIKCTIKIDFVVSPTSQEQLSCHFKIWDFSISGPNLAETKTNFISAPIENALNNRRTRIGNR